MCIYVSIELKLCSHSTFRCFFPFLAILQAFIEIHDTLRSSTPVILASVCGFEACVGLGFWIAVIDKILAAVAGS